MDSLVKYIQKQLDAIRPNAYRVSSERNLKSDFEKHDVVVSSLSGDVYSNSSNIPYQIDILTLDVDEVQADFFVLARNCNNVPFTEVIREGETNFQSVTYNVVFNTPVTMEKSVDVGTNHYARLVAFASVNEMSGINQVKKLSIDGEVIEKLNSSYTYVTEPSSARVSGEELTRSKKKGSTCNIVFTAINKASVFFNKAFKISCGQLPGNTKFTVDFELYNGLKAELPMWVSSYQLIDERAKLPAVNISLGLYDDRGDSSPQPTAYTVLINVYPLSGGDLITSYFRSGRAGAYEYIYKYIYFKKDTVISVYDDELADYVSVTINQDGIYSCAKDPEQEESDHYETSLLILEGKFASTKNGSEMESGTLVLQTQWTDYETADVYLIPETN